MAALDFPDNPTNGQVFDKWTWNGTMWVLTASGSGGGGSGFTFNQDAVPTATSIGDTWYETDTGDSFVWTNDGNSTQWVQFAPGSGGGGGSGFTYVTDTAPTPSKVGDTWFDTSTLASGGTSWLAIEEAPGGEKVWVQFAPGAGSAVSGNWQAGTTTVDAYNNPKRAAPTTAQAVEAAWGQVVGDHIIYRFPNAAARDATLTGTKNIGTHAYLEDKRNLTVWDGSAWYEPGKITQITLPSATGLGPGGNWSVITGSGYTFPSTSRTYQISIRLLAFKGGAAGTINIACSTTVAGPNYNTGWGTPQGGSIDWAWISPGTAGGGSISVMCSAGSMNVDAGVITIADAGGL